jgi:hypothetical protein
VPWLNSAGTSICGTGFSKESVVHHSSELLGATEGLSKQPKHYHVAQWVHTYVLVCLRASWCGGFLLHSFLLVPCVWTLLKSSYINWRIL